MRSRAEFARAELAALRSGGEVEVLRRLRAALPARHAIAAVKHYRAAVAEYQRRSWDDAAAKAGKFVEAVLKALAVHAKVTVP